MAILAIFIDDFACTATWGEANSLNNINPADVRPKILLSSQVLLGNTKPAEPEPRDLAVVTGLTENVESLETRANWALVGEFQLFGLKEALDSAADLPVYLLALVQSCLKLAGPDQGITHVRLALTLRPPTVGTVIIPVINLLERVLLGVRLELGGEALKLALQGGGNPSGTGDAPHNPQFGPNDVCGAAAVWRDGLTAQIKDGNALHPPGGPVLVEIKSFIGSDGKGEPPEMFESMVSGALKQPQREPNPILSQMGSKFDQCVVDTPLARISEADPATVHDVRLPAFVAQFQHGVTLNASQIVLAGAIFLDDGISRILAPASEEAGRADAQGDSKDFRLNYALGYNSQGETKCWNRKKPLLGIGVVLRELLRTAARPKAKDDDQEDTAGEVQKVALNEQGKAMLGPQELGQLGITQAGGISLGIQGLDSDQGREVVLEVRKRMDGSWWLTAHLDERHLRIEPIIAVSDPNKPELLLETDGRYRLIPNSEDRRVLRALQHLVRDGLVLFHPNSNPLLPEPAIS